MTTRCYSVAIAIIYASLFAPLLVYGYPKPSGWGYGWQPQPPTPSPTWSWQRKTERPTLVPTVQPTLDPTKLPTFAPTDLPPTASPTSPPTDAATDETRDASTDQDSNEDEAIEEIAEAIEEIDCSNVQTTITLSTNPLLKMSYVVNVPDTDTNVNFSPDQEAAGGTMSVQLDYEGEGWVALATSQDRLMVNSEAIICLPDDRDVSKYSLSAYSLAGVQKLVDEKQTLTDAVVTQNGGTTTCSFTRLLTEAEEITVDPNGSNIFLWAVGSQNSLSYHRARGSTELFLEQCTVDSSSLQRSPAVVADTAPGPYDNYWKVHGLLMGLAWGFCAPVAVLAAILRRVIPGPDGRWFQIHRTMNVLCTIFTIGGFVAAFMAYQGIGREHFEGKHQQIGLTILIVVLFQVIGGIFRPHLPKAKSTSASTNVGADASSGDEEDGVLNHVEDEKITSTPDKSKKRFLWETGHRIVGTLLLALGAYNGYKGLQLVAVILSLDNDYTTIWLGWIVALVGCGACYMLYQRFMKPKK